MRVERIKCRHSGRLVAAGKPGQAYCGSKTCRAARKREWRRKKYASDPEYRLSQKESTDAWLAEQGGKAAYYREYRRRKRKKELDAQTAVATTNGKIRDGDDKGEATSLGSLFAAKASGSEGSANRDSCLQIPPIISGIYEIFPAGANRDSITVEIRRISNG
jgi:hypothetical protein